MLYAIRTLLGSLRTALIHPGVWLLAWLVVTVPAVLAVAPVVWRLHAALGRHPAAGERFDLALDADFARLHPDAVVPLLGGVVFVGLAYAFLAGGILARVGQLPRPRLRELLADCGRLWLGNLRVLGVTLVACTLTFWGIDLLDAWIREGWAYGADAGAVEVFGWRSRWLSVEFGLEVLRWLWGGVFLMLLWVAKMAMARLAAGGRRSALLAWLRSVLGLLRHPLRAVFLVGLWTALWFAGCHLTGLLTAHLLEGRGELLLGLLAGQATIVWTQIALVASFLAAREFAVGPIRQTAFDEWDDDERSDG